MKEVAKYGRSECVIVEKKTYRKKMIQDKCSFNMFLRRSVKKRGSFFIDLTIIKRGRPRKENVLQSL